MITLYGGLMNIFFTQSTDEYGSQVYGLTRAGITAVIVIIIIIIALALIFNDKERKSVRFSTTQLIFSAMAVALSTVTSMLHLFVFCHQGYLFCSETNSRVKNNRISIIFFTLCYSKIQYTVLIQITFNTSYILK